jgi:hypothetical protein
LRVNSRKNGAEGIYIAGFPVVCNGNISWI